MSNGQDEHDGLWLDAKWLTALRDTCANKSDGRMYLQGALFDKENNQLVASDGHRLLRIPIDLSQTDVSGVYAIPKGPLSAFCVLKDSELTVYNRNNETQCVHKLTRIADASEYPHSANDIINSVLNDDGVETDAVPLNASYVERVAKCFGKDAAIYLRHYGDRTVVNAHDDTGVLPNTSFAIIMGMRMNP